VRENSVYFAKKGAVASDYSPGMVEVALQLAATNKVKISGRTMNATSIALTIPLILFTPPTLHHLPEPETAIGDAPRSQARR